jgi:hypothetical protein
MFNLYLRLNTIRLKIKIEDTKGVIRRGKFIIINTNIKHPLFFQECFNFLRTQHQKEYMDSLGAPLNKL